MSRPLSRLAALAAIPIIAIAAMLAPEPDRVQAGQDDAVLQAAVGAVPQHGVALSAFPPPNYRWLDQAQLGWAGIQTAHTGQFPYEVSDEAGGRNWTYSTQLALDTGSGNSLSLGNTLPVYVWNWYPGHYSQSVLTHRYVSNSVMSAWCGNNSGVIGCAYWTKKPRTEIFYRAPSMSAWSEESVGAVVQHETCHVICVARDQYIIDGLICTGNKDSVMDCGNAARTLQPFDVQTYVGLVTPDHPTGRAISVFPGLLRIHWTQTRSDIGGGQWSPFTSNSAVGTWVVFYFYSHQGYGGWAQQFCSAGYSCMGDNLAGQYDFGQWWLDTFDCVQLRVESRATWWAEQSSQAELGYAAHAGCWR